MGQLEPVGAGRTTHAAATVVTRPWEFSPLAEDRLLDLFERRLSEMTPTEQERAVSAALAVEVHGKAPRR
jgi:hypothetical protein